MQISPREKMNKYWTIVKFGYLQWHGLTILKLPLFTAKETINEMKRRPIEPEICKSHIWYGVHIQTIQGTCTTQWHKKNFFKWVKNLNRQFPKEDMQVVIRCKERWSTSLIIREMQDKTQWDIPSHPLGWPLLERQEIASIDEDGSKDTLCVKCCILLVGM